MLCSQRAEGVDDVIIIICILYDLVYWEISYIWSEGILGDYEIALYSSVFPVILIGLVVGGLLYIAFPLLLIVGIIALAASRS